jgi:hypothetical protein
MRELEDRVARGAPWGANIVGWLNDREDGAGRGDRVNAAARKRILDLINAVKRTLDLHSRTSVEDLSYMFPAELLEAVLNLNTRLAEYSMTPILSLGQGHESSFEFAVTEGPRHMREVVAAQAVLKLAEMGTLSRVSLCICGYWFYAVRETQKSCSDRCRHKAYEQTDAYKEKRRAYMREYYALRKTGKVK